MEKNEMCVGLSHCSYKLLIARSIQLENGGSLKVSKSQKYFFLETPLPKKRTKYLTKFCPSFIGHNFDKYFVRFLGIGVSRKNAFDIYVKISLGLDEMKLVGQN